MSTDATGQTYHVVQLRGQGNVPLYPAIQKAEVINQQTSASSLPPTTKAVVDYVQQAVQGGSGGAANLGDLQDVSITQSSAERQLLTGDGTTWSNSLEVVDSPEVIFDYPFAFTLTRVTALGSPDYVVFQTSGTWAGKYVSDLSATPALVVYDLVLDEAGNIARFYVDDNIQGDIGLLAELTDAGNYILAHPEDGRGGTAWITDITYSKLTYENTKIPTLAGVKDVFDTDYFNIEDGKRVSPKNATNGIKGVASFDANMFAMLSGHVRLNTYTGTNTTNISVDYVKIWKTYSDGSWYRLWASGWLEQGGKVISTSAKSVTVSLPLEFSDIDYNLQYTTSRKTLTETATAQLRYYSYSNKTTTSFTVYAVVSADYGHTWYACGWSA